MKIRDFTVNSILVGASTLLGFLIINQALVYLSSNNSQRHGFPRNYLRYLEPVARWKYPDFNNSKTKQDATFIVGDSYAEGAGDSFLSNEYNYSIGHFFNNEYRENTNIYYVANSGSSIPQQLILLKMHISGKLKPLSVPPKKFKALNIILYFYEGNDLEDTATSKLLPYQSWKHRFRLYFPIIYAGHEALRDLKGIFSQSESNSLSSPSNVNKICIGTTCRDMSPMQSASAGLSEKQISNEISYLADSVKEFSLEYPKAKMCFVYIPSPSTIYSPKGWFYYQKYPIHLLPSDIKTTAELNNSKSLLIRKMLRNRLDLNSIIFIDSTNNLKREALKGFLHGTIDQKHFTANGYRLIADATAQGCPID